MKRTKVMARRDAFDDRIRVLVCEVDFSNRITAVAEPVVMRERNSIEPIERETLRLDYEAAQSLMDELWTCGLRPTDGSGSAGALAATQKHLDDMRTLVFHLSNVASRP